MPQLNFYRELFLTTLIAVLVTIAIVQSVPSAPVPAKYVGEGMAVCHKETPVPDTYDTWAVEFVDIEFTSHNKVTVTLKSGEKLIGFLPCLTNFDRREP